MNAAEYLEDPVNEIVSSPRKLSAKLEEYAVVMREKIKSRIIKTSHDGIGIFIGDIHGDLETLKKILRRVDLASLEAGDTMMVFLGDYIDRGPEQLESLITVLELWALYPEKVVMLRGNHEPLAGVSPYPHDFPRELIDRFGYEAGNDLYSKARDLFDRLPFVALINSNLVAVHGGLPTSTYKKTDKIEEYLLGERGGNFDVLVELLWNDPIDEPLVRMPSPRGAGYLWGTTLTDWVKSAFGIKLVVRGHEPAELGYKFNHGGSVLTLFSRLGPPYFNQAAAIAVFDFSSEEWMSKIPSYIQFINY